MLVVKTTCLFMQAAKGVPVTHLLSFVASFQEQANGSQVKAVAEWAVRS
jgi:hypothetical protein